MAARARPVYWDSNNELWGISRYDDILEIEKAKDVFINSDEEKGGYRPNLPADHSIIGIDDPLHTKRRKLVARRFTPARGDELGGRRSRDGRRSCSTRSRRVAATPRSSATSPRRCPR